MKKLKYFAIIALTAVAFSSCDNNELQRPLTPEERLSAFNEVKGDYAGELTYLTGEKDAQGRPKVDTLQVEWSILSDTVMVIKNFPTKVFAPNADNTLLKGELLTAPNVDLKCYIEFFQKEPALFSIFPVPPVFNFHYGDKNHTVTPLFTSTRGISFGGITTTNHLWLQLIPSAIMVDGKATLDPLYNRNNSVIIKSKDPIGPKKK